MKTPRLGPITDGLLYTADIPLCWQRLSDMPSDHDLRRLNESNRRVFQLLLKEGKELDREAIPVPVASELQRLDSKLDLLIDMVGNLLTREYGIPASRNIWLGREGLQVSLGSASDDDSLLARLPVIPINESASKLDTSYCLVEISLFLDGHIPQPVVLLANVVIVNNEETERLMLATFIEMGQEVQGLLEKFIFQQHRRVIASTRMESAKP